jgi:3-O-methylgallate 3,4-dioxygenase
LKTAKPGIENEITDDVIQKNYDNCYQSIAQFRELLLETAPDVIVMVANDQNEMFQDDNLPMFSIYRGAKMKAHKKTGKLAAWQEAEVNLLNHSREFDAHPQLADHLIKSLIENRFDLAISNRFGENSGLGHAFTFLYEHLLPEGHDIPMVPVTINTFYPPNQVHPRRCYELGESIRTAINAWDEDKRVAIVFSGGLSHTIIDEELDKMTLEAIKNRDRETLCTLPVEKLVNGSSEIRNWIACSAILEELDTTVLNYIPCYRSPAGTGCGMGFVYWK